MKTLKITPENYEQYKGKHIEFNGNISFRGIETIECKNIRTYGGWIDSGGGSVFSNVSISNNVGSIFTDGSKRCMNSTWIYSK